MIEKLWVDVETTGTDPENDTIIELAMTYQDKVFHKYCLPDKKPDNFEEITEITGITWDFLKENGVISEKILFHSFITGINSLINVYSHDDKLILSGYKIDFDISFLRELFLKNGNEFFGMYFFYPSIDVRTFVANELSSGRLKLLENYKLETVCKAYNIEFKAHSAIKDIKATKELYEKIMEANISGST